MSEKVVIGSTVWLRFPDTKIMSEPKIGGNVLQHVGHVQVQWLGQVPGDKIFHKIRFKGRECFVAAQALSKDNPTGLNLFYLCASCGGNGFGQLPSRPSGFTGIVMSAVCTACNGTGHVAGKPMSSQAFASSGGTKA